MIVPELVLSHIRTDISAESSVSLIDNGSSSTRPSLAKQLFDEIEHGLLARQPSAPPAGGSGRSIGIATVALPRNPSLRLLT